MLDNRLGGLPALLHPVLLLQLLPVLVDCPQKAGQRQVQRGRERKQEQEDAQRPANRLSAGQTEQHRQQAAQHAAGGPRLAAPVELGDQRPAPAVLRFGGQMGNGRDHQGKAQRAEHPHQNGLSAVKEQGNRAEHQPDRQDIEAHLAGQAHEELPQRAAAGKAAQENDQRQKAANAAPDLPPEMRQDALLAQRGLLAGRLPGLLPGGGAFLFTCFFGTHLMYDLLSSIICHAAIRNRTKASRDAPQHQ